MSTSKITPQDDLLAEAEASLDLTDRDTLPLGSDLPQADAVTEAKQAPIPPPPLEPHPSFRDKVHSSFQGGEHAIQGFIHKEHNVLHKLTHHGQTLEDLDAELGLEHLVRGTILGVKGREGYPTVANPGFEFDVAGKIKSYDAHKVYRMGWLSMTRSSVFESTTVKAAFVFYGLLALAVALAICPTCTATSCAACYRGLSPLTANSRFAVVVAIALAVFVGLCVVKWWMVRSRLAEVVSGCNDMTMLATTYIRKSDARSEWLRQELVRYCNLAHVLVYKQARNMMVPDDVIESKLCTPAEWDLLHYLPNKYMMVYYWSCELVSYAADEGYLMYPEVLLPVVHKTVAKQRDAAEAALSAANTQLPFPYVHLLGSMVRCHMLMVAMGVATQLSQAVASGQIYLGVQAYVELLFATLMFEGMLQLHANLHSPFQMLDCDLPVHSYVDDAWQTTTSLLDQKHHLPFSRAMLDSLDSMPQPDETGHYTHTPRPGAMAMSQSGIGEMDVVRNVIDAADDADDFRHGAARIREEQQAALRDKQAILEQRDEELSAADMEGDEATDPAYAAGGGEDQTDPGATAAADDVRPAAALMEDATDAEAAAAAEVDTMAPEPAAAPPGTPSSGSSSTGKKKGLKKRSGSKKVKASGEGKASR